MIIGIYNSHCSKDFVSANENDEITWTANSFSNKAELDGQLSIMSTIICACYKEDEMEYCAKNLLTGKIVSLEDYWLNRDFTHLMEQLNDEKPTMKKYKVTITRTEYQTMEFNVEATCESDAEELAEQMAYDTEFSRGQAHYDVEGVQEI